jgi:PKD repeat protein
MRFAMDLVGRALGCLALLGASATTQAQSQFQAEESPLLVTYGPAASTTEGDPDYRQVMFLSVPDSAADRLHLRVFDLDTGGEHDLIYGESADTEVRFALFGGKGSYSEVAGAAVEIEPQRLVAGTLIGERSIGASDALDDRWQTLFSVAPDQGEALDGRRVFRLQIEGMAGDDANLYDVTVSLREHRNLAPDGLEISDFAPTARSPDSERLTELRFRVPDDAERLTVRNFDAANASLAFASTYRVVPLDASGQGEWASSEVAVEPSERGELAAITFSGGDELPNDITLVVLDQAGRPLPLQLPARLWQPNARPLPAAAVELLADCVSVAFDASSSSDPNGDRLSYTWRFGDGASDVGRALVHRYPGPGTYLAMLGIRDSSGQIGSGAERRFEVLVKRPPTTRTGEDVVVAPSEAVVFDGSGSLPGERPIVSYAWDFDDGGRGDGPSVEHSFAAPGRYVVTLRVADDTAPPCNVASDRQIVQVNARPIAVPGEEQRVSPGQKVVLDGARSYDVDGEITAHHWDLSDGTALAGARVEHAFAAPGSYLATLTVEDAAGVANSRGSDTVRILVNAPPVAAAGPDRHVAMGEVITFDAGGSSDADGSLINHAWTFGDGAQGNGPVVQYAYPQAGVYRVELTVRDDSSTASDTASDGFTVVINAPPVADAGPDQRVTTSGVAFDGKGSSDPDGTIARYVWDFGDGAKGGGPTPMHVYEAPGVYQVRLAVTDDSGTLRSGASDTMQVVVNAAPIADAGPDLVGAPG